MLCHRLSLIVMLLLTVLGVADETYKRVERNNLPLYWIRREHASAGSVFPDSTIQKHMDVCVAVGFVIGADGIPTDVHVLRSVTSIPSDIAETRRVESAAVRAVSALRYDAAPRNTAQQPVLTYLPVALAVNAPEASSEIVKKHRQAVKESCHIPGFADPNIDAGSASAN